MISSALRFLPILLMPMVCDSDYGSDGVAKTSIVHGCIDGWLSMVLSLGRILRALLLPPTLRFSMTGHYFDKFGREFSDTHNRRQKYRQDLARDTFLDLWGQVYLKPTKLHVIHTNTQTHSPWTLIASSRYQNQNPSYTLALFFALFLPCSRCLTLSSLEQCRAFHSTQKLITPLLLFSKPKL